MSKQVNRAAWLPIVAASALMAACGGTSTLEDPTSAVSQALEPTSNSTNAAEAAGLMRGIEGFRSDAHEYFRCDSEPDIRYVSVCGQSLPATVHLEWTQCAAPMGPGSGPEMGQAPHEGGLMAPPPGGCMSPPPARPPEGAFPGGHRSPGGRGGERGAPSSGVVDIAHAYVPAADCSSIAVQEVATFQVDRTRPDGEVLSVAGTTTSTSQLIPGAGPLGKSTELDVTRTVTDASGVVVHSVHLTGSNQVEFSGGPPPNRTLNGSMTAEFSDGSQGQVTVTDLVHPPMQVCPWPTSGTIVRVKPDGTSHSMSYGPSCGQATLDGSAVTLPDRPGGGPRKH